jgi:hypothetical protein
MSSQKLASLKKPKKSKKQAKSTNLKSTNVRMDMKKERHDFLTFIILDTFFTY